MAGYWLSSQSGNSSALRFPLGNTLLSSSFHKPQTLQNGIFLTSALLLPLLHGKTNQARSTNIYLEKPQPFRMFYTLIHLEKDMMRLKKSQIILIGFIFLPFFSFPSPSVQEQPLTDSYVALPSKKFCLHSKNVIEVMIKVTHYMKEAVKFIPENLRLLWVGYQSCMQVNTEGCFGKTEHSPHKQK